MMSIDARAARSLAVSVVIPVYNRRDVLPRALRSVINQTFADFEVIVVDDGSTDASAEVPGEFSDDRIKLVRHPRQCGAPAARNTGIRLARGDYIALLDSDDEWLPDKLEQQITFMKSSTTRCDVSCTAYFLHRLGDTEGQLFQFDPTVKTSDLLWGCKISPGSTLVVSRDHIDLVGLFDERLRRLEDWDWLLRSARYGNISIMNLPLARIHISPGSPNISQALRALEIISSESDKYGIYRRSLISYLKFQSTILVERSANYYRTGNYTLALWFGILSLVKYPFRDRRFFARATTLLLELWRTRSANKETTKDENRSMPP